MPGPCGLSVASLEVPDVFPWDKARYVQAVYGTPRWDHPGGQMVQTDPRLFLYTVGHSHAVYRSALASDRQSSHAFVRSAPRENSSDGRS